MYRKFHVLWISNIKELWKPWQLLNSSVGNYHNTIITAIATVKLFRPSSHCFKSHDAHCTNPVSITICQHWKPQSLAMNKDLHDRLSIDTEIIIHQVENCFSFAIKWRDTLNWYTEYKLYLVQLDNDNAKHVQTTTQDAGSYPGIFFDTTELMK